MKGVTLQEKHEDVLLVFVNFKCSVVEPLLSCDEFEFIRTIL